MRLKAFGVRHALDKTITYVSLSSIDVLRMYLPETGEK